ncbi:hypothetical protein KHX94_02775 [Shewanella dokdonensis]|uniref:Glycosyltransferase n=1 Tax=Shewanella dokdonensis TaxID=712036 RepID=A0ABX8DG03_9GAMM|nr:hypothetical protein [Shewanella dokdonensis]QVK23663.1 hypothetical protein KHX94_02775 [Shewanella dokdonensis]
MNILHIVAGDLSGGAARGAYWLHLSLKEKGINSKILNNSNSFVFDEDIILSNKTIFEKTNAFFRKVFDRFLISFYVNRKDYIFSTGIVGCNFKKIHEYKNADIIHLHWINGSMIDIKDLHKLDKPIVWTMRDMWPFTGGCHYAIKCDGYKDYCCYCPQLQSKRKYSLASFLHRRKIKLLPKKLRLLGLVLGLVVKR